MVEFCEQPLHELYRTSIRLLEHPGANGTTIIIIGGITMADLREVAINYIVGDKLMSVTAGDNKWRNKILAWAEEKPDEVTITNINKDGTVVAIMPTKYFKLSPPREMSDEQRAATAERLRAIRNPVN